MSPEDIEKYREWEAFDTNLAVETQGLLDALGDQTLRQDQLLQMIQSQEERVSGMDPKAKRRYLAAMVKVKKPKRVATRDKSSNRPSQQANFKLSKQPSKDQASD